MNSIHFIIETEQNKGLGHLIRCINFYQQIAHYLKDTQVYFFTFGNHFIPLNKEINSKQIAHRHFNNLENAIIEIRQSNLEYHLVDRQTRLNQWLIFDLDFKRAVLLADFISFCKPHFVTIGFYNHLNKIIDLPLDVHVNSLLLEEDKLNEKFKKKETLILNGFQFRIFSNEFIKLYNKKSKISNTGNKINFLVIAGNTDPQNRIQPILQIIKDLTKKEHFSTNLSFHIIHSKDKNGMKFDEIKYKITDKVEIVNYTHLNQQELIKLYAKINFAITAVGSTFWELDYLNIPCLLIPGSLTEDETALWLQNNKMAERLISVQENFNQTHFTKISSWINTKISNFKSNSGPLHSLSHSSLESGSVQIYQSIKSYLS